MGSPVATYPRITSSLRLANSTSVPSKNDTRWTWEQSSDLVKIKESKPVRWCLWPQCSPHWTPGVLTRSMLRWSCMTRQCSFTTETGHKSCQPHGILCVYRLLVDPAIVRHNCIGSYKMVKWMVKCSRNANFSWFWEECVLFQLNPMEDNGDTYHYKRLLEALFLKGLKHMVDFQSCRVYRIILVRFSIWFQWIVSLRKTWSLPS